MSRPTGAVALVSGAAKGIGLEIVRGLATRGYAVFLGARDRAKGHAAADALANEGDVRFVRLDVTDEASIAEAVRAIGHLAHRLDVLVNNAGVLLDEGRNVADVETAVLRQTLETNVLGAFALTRACLPLLRRSPHPRIVNVSSTAGSLADMAATVDGGDDFPAPSYRVSKAALNALTLVLAKDLRSDRILVNACCPGWVRTDMGGPNATLSPAEGAVTPLFLATLPDGGPTGGFFAEGVPTPW
jgi:NAD(P)-dependent dehydrogenase (short-subunit alcohol dehydrogenase family)